MAKIMYQANGVVNALASSDPNSQFDSTTPLESLSGARLTILNAVRDGTLTPEAALRALFD